MQNVSLQGFVVNPRRMAAIFVGALLWLVLVVAGVVQLTVAGAWRGAGVVVAFAGSMVLVLGTRMWAATPVRHELDEGGLSTFGQDGELRERVRWSQMHEYLIDTLPRTRIRQLLITLADERQIHIVEGRTAEQKQAFDAFCSSFVSAAAQQQATMPNVAVREGVSFYDTQGARVIGMVLLVLFVGALGGSFFLPSDGLSDRMYSMVILMVVAPPIIYRTVFAHRPAKRPAPPSSPR